MKSADTQKAAQAPDQDPRPEETYLAFVLRQVAPKARRLAIWTARIATLVLILLLVPPSGRWVGQKLTTLSTRWHRESGQAPPMVTEHQEVPPSVPDNRAGPPPTTFTEMPPMSTLPPPHRVASREPPPTPEVVKQVAPSPRPVLVSIPAYSGPS